MLAILCLRMLFCSIQVLLLIGAKVEKILYKQKKIKVYFTKKPLF